MKTVPLKYSLDPWIERLDFYHNWLLYAKRRKDERLLDSAMRLYSGAARDLYEVTKDLRGHRYAKNPVPRIPLEVLERDFMTLRDRANREDRLARKFGGRRSKRGRTASRAAANVARAAREAARALKAEMQHRGLWSDEFGREFEIDLWL